MNLAIKELADTKFEVLLCCCLSILNLFLLISTKIFLCDKLDMILKNKMFENWSYQRMSTLKVVRLTPNHKIQ